MGELWIPEAERLSTGSHPGTMEGGNPKATWHVTVSPSGGGFFDAMRRVLVDKQAEPHFLYDPLTDRLGQFFPLNASARALGNDGTRRTNGSGSVNIQTEVVAQADDFTRYWKPGPNYRALLRGIRSWGVPDVWPGGDPYGRPARSWETYRKAGHFGHVHVPGNDHYDPQVRDGELLFLKEDDMTPEQSAKLDEILRRVYDAEKDAAEARKQSTAASIRTQGITAALKAFAASLPAAVADQVTAALSAEYDAKVELTPKEN